MNSKQKIILRRLVVKNGQRYSELSRSFEPEDRFHYHIKRLVKVDYLNKSEDKYFLTKEGLQATQSFNSRTLDDEIKPQVLFGFIISYKDQYFLTYDFINNQTKTPEWYRLVRGTPLFGENTQQSCNRILKQKIDLEPISIKYKDSFRLQQVTEDDSIIYDNIFSVFEVEADEDFYNSSKDSSNIKLWFTSSEIRSLSNKWPEVDLVLKDSKYKSFDEISFVCNYNLRKEITNE